LGELKEEASEVKKEETPPEIKDEINEIQRSETDSAGVFLELQAEIVRKLRMISECRDFSGYRYRSVRDLTRILVQQGVITEPLAELITRFWHIRNEIIHCSEAKISNRALKDAV
jgi:uncharacterized protein YutE (UPF0331/DUF86 family)